MGVRREDNKNNGVLGVEVDEDEDDDGGSSSPMVLAIRWPTSIGTAARSGACWRHIAGDPSS